MVTLMLVAIGALGMVWRLPEVESEKISLDSKETCCHQIPNECTNDDCRDHSMKNGDDEEKKKKSELLS